LPIAPFNAAYNGSKSMRAGMIWEVLMTLGAETVIDLVARMGVDSCIDGRLNAAGSMSGMVVDEVWSLMLR
jgi:hypothetical protein